MNRLLENDLYVRLIALFLAVVLWLYVVNEHSPQVQRTFTIPIKYINQSPDLVLMDKVTSVKVKITGLNDNVLAIDQSQIKAEVDLKGAEEGNYYLPLKVSAPFTVKIAEFNPKKVPINLQNIVSKRVALVPQVKGSNLEKKSVSGIASDLKEIKVTGPEKQVDKVRLGLAVVDISQLIGNKTTVKIIPVDELGQAVSDIQVEPKFTQIIVSTLPLKQLAVSPVLVGKPADGYRIKEVTAVPNMVKVSGNHLEKINSLKTLPIDITGLDSNIQKETELILPNGVMALEKQTVKVLLLIEKELQENKDENMEENAAPEEKENPES